MPTEQEQFLKDLEPDKKPDVLTESLTPPAEAKAEDAPNSEPTEEEKFNRRERRLTAKLQAERESSIALAARLEALSEAQKARQESEPDEWAKSVERIYGTGTPEATEATELLKSALKGVEQQATERALNAFREEQAQAAAEVSKEEKNLDVMLEEIEDKTGYEMDAQTRTGFFQLLEKLSPKDSDGNIIAYADHHAVWEELQARRKPADTRAKDLAARSMASSGASPKSTVEAEATERFLRENGLI